MTEDNMEESTEQLDHDLFHHMVGNGTAVQEATA